MSRIFTIARRHAKILACWNIALVCMAGVTLIREKPIWTANGSLILSANNRNLNASLGKLGSVTDGETYYSQQVDPLTILINIITSNETMEQIRAIDPEADMIKNTDAYKGYFLVKPQEGSTIMNVTVTGRQADITQKRADALFSVFQQRLNQLRQQDASQRSNFMQKELEESRKNLRDAQLALTNYKQSTGLINSEEQTKQLVITVNSLTAARSEALGRATSQATQLKILQERLAINPAQAVRSLQLGENQDYQIAKKQLTETELDLAKANAQYQPDAPEVKLLQDERDRLQQQLNQYISNSNPNKSENQSDSEINGNIGNNLGDLMKQMVLTEGNAQSSQNQANQLTYQISQLNQQIKKFPLEQAKLQEFQRQYEIAEGVHTGLIAKVQETKVNSFSNYPSVQVLDNPKVSDKPGGSKRIPILMGTFLASIFGTIALALLRESRNPLLSPKDVQTSEFPVIGTLPVLQPTWENPGGGAELEFQRLASAISMMPLNARNPSAQKANASHHYPHRLMIASASPNEGRSTVTIGIANALVSLGFQVLIIDGDLRKGKLRQRFGIPSTIDSTGICSPVTPGLDLLCITVLTKGIMEFVARGNFEQTLQTAELSKSYDYVLLDSAPICTTGESALLGTLMKNILWVVRPGTSERFAMIRAIAQLTRHHVHIAGIVINGHEPEGTNPSPKAFPRLSLSLNRKTTQTVRKES
jgi:succinoglycan biosynthesis transport protein ExoP